MIIMRQKNYSKYTIKQKEFNKVLDKIRGSISKKITKSIVNDINSLPDSYLFLRNPKKIRSNKNLRSSLYKKARENGARISTINIGGPVTTTKDTYSRVLLDANRFPNNPKKIKRYRKRALNQGVGKYQIIVPPKTGIDELSHEIGHVINLESKNPIIHKVSKISSDPKIREKHNTDYDLIYNINGPGNHKRHGIKNVLRDFIENRSILADERRASRNGIKLLKKSGVSREDIDKAKKNMKTALNIYKRKGNVNWKTTLRNTIQTKDKRTSDIFYD